MLTAKKSEMNHDQEHHHHQLRQKQQSKHRVLRLTNWNIVKENRSNPNKSITTPPAVFIYKINDGSSGSAGTAWKLLHEVCADRGWTQLGAPRISFLPGGGNSNCYFPATGGTEENDSCLSSDEEENADVYIGRRQHGGSGPGTDWNFWWRSCGGHKIKLKPWQMTNHCRSWVNFSRKDYLARYLKRMQQNYGGVYSFSPVSFNLPLEYAKLCTEHSRRNTDLINANDSNRPIWICKPVAKSQGRGIQIFDTVTALTYDSASVVQEYILRPYLIGDYKWDLRLYVCVRGVNPPTIHIYREGLARFATSKYNLDAPFDPFIHLTNTTVNKLSPSYSDCKEVVGSGCKWPLRRLRKYFSETGVDDWMLWQRIVVIIILTVIGEASGHGIFEDQTSFELLGFDIIVDHKLRPVLLEVNTNPSLSNDCHVDEVVKRPMLDQLMSLLGLPMLRPETTSGGVDMQDWVQVYPFSSDQGTNRLTSNSLKQVVGHLREYLKLVRRISLTKSSENVRDSLLLHNTGYSSARVWHS